MITNILEFLETAGRKFPAKQAFSDDQRSISYSELIIESKKIATKISNAIRNRTKMPVLVFVDRNVESIIAFMGTAYSGNFYAPIDSTIPVERLSHIINSLNPEVCICFNNKQNALLNQIAYNGIRIDYNSEFAEELDENLLYSIRKKSIDLDPLYVIFTSGSTGVPKGVVISMRAVIDLTEWLVETFNFHESEIIGSQTPFYFDGSVKDIYVTIRAAASTHIISRKYFSFPPLLINLLNEKKITTILWATSAVNLVANSGILEEIKPESITKIFFAGEAMIGKHLNIWQKHLPDAQYINLYGPTEITVDCTYFIVNRDFQDDEYIPIGFPCKNKEIILLDENNKIIEGPGPGELCVRGTGLSPGYFNDTVKSSEVFIQNPSHNNFRDIIYKTGDLAIYNSNDELVFLSRKDNQVKHQGNRIELGEIEVAVGSHPEVSIAACIYDINAEKILLYYTGIKLADATIMEHLKDRIPKYMYPGSYIYLEEMPFNKNGKIDRILLSQMNRNENS